MRDSCYSNNLDIDYSNGDFAIPGSVIIPLINSGGVISKAGFMTSISSGAVYGEGYTGVKLTEESEKILFHVMEKAN